MPSKRRTAIASPQFLMNPGSDRDHAPADKRYNRNGVRPIAFNGHELGGFEDNIGE